MENLEKETKFYMKKLEKIVVEIKEKFEIEKSHFVELCVYFHNFCNDDTSINKESFISANSELCQSELDDEEIDALSEEVFNIISDSKSSAYLFALNSYLLSISYFNELSEENIIEIIDKTNVGFVDESELDLLINGMETFLGEKLDWSKFKARLKNNLINTSFLASSKTFVENFKVLFLKIEEKVKEISLKSLEVKESKESKKRIKAKNKDSERSYKDKEKGEKNRADEESMSELTNRSKKSKVSKGTKMSKDNKNSKNPSKRESHKSKKHSFVDKSKEKLKEKEGRDKENNDCNKGENVENKSVKNRQEKEEKLTPQIDMETLKHTPKETETEMRTTKILQEKEDFDSEKAGFVSNKNKTSIFDSNKKSEKKESDKELMINNKILRQELESSGEEDERQKEKGEKRRETAEKKKYVSDNFNRNIEIEEGNYEGRYENKTNNNTRANLNTNTVNVTNSNYAIKNSVNYINAFFTDESPNYRTQHFNTITANNNNTNIHINNSKKHHKDLNSNSGNNNNLNTISANFNHLNSLKYGSKEVIEYNNCFETEPSPMREVDFADFNTLFNVVFDKEKLGKVHRIKMISLLYDINLDEFYEDFAVYKDENFNKEQFIFIVNNIIISHTSNIFKSPLQKYSLSLLYHYLNISKKQSLSFYEILGGMIALTKSKNMDRISLIYKHNKMQIKLIFNGILALYFNADIMRDLDIFSEIVMNVLSNLNIETASDFYEFIFNKEELVIDENLIEFNNELFDIAPETGDLLTDEEKENNEFIIKSLNAVFEGKIKINLNILKITEIMINKYSVLNQISNKQLLDLVTEIFDLTQSPDEFLREKEKEKFLDLLEKHFNFSEVEFVETSKLHCLFLLVFSGSVKEKIRSLFLVFDENENVCLENESLVKYFRKLFEIMLNKFEIHDFNYSIYMSKRLVAQLSGGKDGVSFSDIFTFFEEITE